MGAVWRATDQKLQRVVAVKEIDLWRSHTDDKLVEQRRRAVREARAAAAVHHPNIVAVHDVVDDDERPWIVMQLVSGEQLSRVVADEGPLDVDRTAGIGLRLLDALAAAHAAGVVHRDVKPANILLGPDDAVWLSDFGIASVHGHTTLTETGIVLGTPGYLAPEQARGEPVGSAADVFGLGASLYYALEGVGPFDRGNPVASIAAVLYDDPPVPRHAGRLAPALTRMLAKDPAERATVAEAKHLLGGQVATGHRSTRTRLRRRRLLLGVAAAVSAAGTGVGAAVLAPRGGRRHGTPGTGRPSPSATPAVLRWHLAGAGAPVFAGSTLYVGTDAGVLAVDPASGAVRWRRDLGAPPGAAVPTGTSLVCVRVDTVVGIDAATGAVRWTRDGQFFSPVAGDGVAYLAGGDRGRDVLALDARTGDEPWRSSPPRGVPGALATADGAGLYAGAWDPTGHATIYAVDTAARPPGWRPIANLPGGVQRLVVAPPRAYAVIATTEGSTQLVALDLATGRLPWKMAVGGPEARTVGFMPTPTALYLSIGGPFDGVGSAVLAVRPDTGEVAWRQEVLGPCQPVVADNLLYVGGFDSMLYALDPATGRTVWSQHLPGPVQFVAAGGGRIYATAPGGLYAFEP